MTCIHLCLALLAILLAAARAEFRAGFAERDITPEPGSERPGGYGKAFNDEKVHDRCKVRASVFDDGSRRVALVGIDSLTIRRELVLEARERIREKCGIEPGAVMVGASHTHSGGPTSMIQPGDFDHASDFIKFLAYRKSSCADAAYNGRVRDAIVDAVVAANSAAQVAKVSFGSGQAEQVSFNRRVRMKNGLSFSHPGRGNPDSVEFAGPIDPQVNVVGVWTAERKLLGCVVNFSCHATCGPGGVSADWIYYLEKAIRGFYGLDVVVVYLQGACGDITQVNNLTPYADWSGDRMAQIVGGAVGAEAIKVLTRAPETDTAPLAAKSTLLRIPRRAPAKAKLEQALAIAQRPESEAGPAVWTFAKEILLLGAMLQKEPVAEVEVQGVQIGPTVFLSNPAECFVQHGLNIKKGSPFPLTSVVELANGCVGYVPTEEAFGPHGGGYETRLTSYSNLEITAGTQIEKASIELARALTPAPLPDRPKAPPFKTPWAYGNVRPEVE